MILFSRKFSFQLENTANNGSLGIPHGCNCKNNGSYTVRASVRQRMCGFALPTWRICRSAIRIHLRFANERASHSYMQWACVTCPRTCVRVREEVQSGSTKVVAFHKGHIHHNVSLPREGIKINPQQPHLAHSASSRAGLLQRSPFSGLSNYVNNARNGCSSFSLFVITSIFLYSYRHDKTCV